MLWHVPYSGTIWREVLQGRGEESSWDRGLTIGGYVSAWFVDLVAAFLLETATLNFKDTLFHVIYRDDGIVVFKGNKNKKQLEHWLGEFQRHIDDTLQSTLLKFTVGLWDPLGNKDFDPKSKVTVNTNATYPFLDIQFFWSNLDLLGT